MATRRGRAGTRAKAGRRKAAGSKRGRGRATAQRAGLGWGCELTITQPSANGKRRTQLQRQSLLRSATSSDDRTAAVVKSARAYFRRLDRAAIASVLSSLGHSQRLAILYRLAEGPADYRALEASTSLQAGPLYHHVANLRMAGLVAGKQRNHYELTDLGRRITPLTALVPELARTSKAS